VTVVSIISISYICWEIEWISVRVDNRGSVIICAMEGPHRI
jgi:hypothetical protein